MMTMLRSLAWCASLLCAFACGDDAEGPAVANEVVSETRLDDSPEGPSEVTGRVLDSAGQALAGAWVSIRFNRKGRATIRTGKTDADGRYRLRDVSLGRAAIRWGYRRDHRIWTASAPVEVDRRGDIELEDQRLKDAASPCRLIIRDEHGDALRVRVEVEESSRLEHPYLFERWFEGECVIHGLIRAATYRILFKRAGYQRRTLHLKPAEKEREKTERDRILVPSDDLGSATLTHTEASATLELVMKAHRKDPRQATISLSGSAPDGDFVATVFKMSDSKKLAPLRVAMAEGAWPPEFGLFPGRHFIDVFAAATSTPDSRRPARFFAREFEVAAGENASIPVDWEDGVLVAGRIESKEGQSPGRMSRLITDTEGPLSPGSSEFDFKGRFEIWVAPTRRLRLHASFGSGGRIYEADLGDAPKARIDLGILR